MSSMLSPEVSAPLNTQDSVPIGKVCANIFAQAGPAVLSNLLTFTTELINTVFIGQYGSKDQLAAVGLGKMMQNVFGLSIGIGLAGAIDTLSSQANGAGEKRQACIYMQRARLILSLQVLWMWPLLAYCDVWLTAIGQDPTVARLAAEYNRATAPFLFVIFQNLCMRRLLTAFLRPRGNIVISCITTVLHGLWVVLLVGHLGLGNMGLGLSNGISWTTRFILLTVHWWRIAPGLGLQRRWVLGFDAESLRAWREFLKVGMPSLLQTSSEWWFWEICALVVGYLGPTALAAHVAVIQFITLPFMVPIGIGQGASTLVGNAIGAGLPRLAKRTGMASVGLVLLAWALISLVTLIFCNQIAAMLSNAQDVQSIIKVLLLIYMAQGFFDASQNTMGGVLRGLGEMVIPSITYLVSFYMVMLPLAILFAFPCKLGVTGVWLAMGVGTGFATLVFAWVLVKKDYEAIVRNARQRMSREERTASCG